MAASFREDCRIQMRGNFGVADVFEGGHAEEQGAVGAFRDMAFRFRIARETGCDCFYDFRTSFHIGSSFQDTHSASCFLKFRSAYCIRPRTVLIEHF